MKHLSGLWHKLTVIVAVTASLSSCNRAEYAMLPKTTSYHGTAQRAVAVSPAKEATYEAATPALPAEEVAVNRVADASATTEAPAEVLVTKKVAAVPATKRAKAVAAPKLNVMQKALVQKVVTKVDKLADKVVLKQRTETASADEASALDRNIRNGIILLLVGLLVSLFSGISGIFGVLGGIISIIGIVLIILGLLDSI